MTPMRRNTQFAAIVALLICLCGSARADIVQQIAALVPERPHSYAQMYAKLASLARSDRVSLVSLGCSSLGRDVLCVAVHDPATVFGQTPRLFVIGRQHGNEPSGTEAALAFVQHFATTQGELERETLKRLTIVAVPMANPDGAEKGRRRNGNNVDLNRDWLGQTQPEVKAIETAVRVWRPNALMDLHDLPRSAPRPSYRENFVETIGDAAGIPAFVSSHTLPAAADIARWLHGYGHRANVYYDGPGKDRSLCHRHFGLDRAIPSFLFEAKTGPGRTLRHRASFHALGMLVVANHLLHTTPTGTTTDGLQMVQTPSTPGPRASTGPARVGLQFGTTQSGMELSANVQGGDVRYVKFYLNGHLSVITNTEPYVCRLSAEDHGTGRHQVRADVIGLDGKVLARAHETVEIDHKALGE